MKRSLRSEGSICPRFSLFVLLILGLQYPTVFAQQGVLFLNEVLASNSEILETEEGETEDWVEIYNAGAVPLDLTGMWISDDAAEPAKHVLAGPAEELTVPPGGHLLLWASGNIALGARHLGFKLSSSGEQLLLSSSMGELVDMVLLPQQVTNVSYGRAGDGGATWYFFDQPTPEAPNAQQGLLGQVAAPAFSVAAGFFSSPIQVSITHPDPQAEIYYSLDGSVPGPELLEGYTYGYKNIYPVVDDMVVGELRTDTLWAYPFNGAITLTDPSSDPNWLSRRTTTAHSYHPTEYMPQVPIRKARVVRARAFREGYLPSEVVTSTYFFTSDGASPYTLPVLSLSTEKEHLFGHFNGVYNAGVDYEEWRLSNPNTLLTGDTPANWRRSTEAPVGMEWFDEGTTTRTFHRNAGFRLHGAFSKTFRRKSLRLYFRNGYGFQDLGHALFPSQTDTDFRRLVVHISGNDDVSTNMRDMTLQALLRHMRFETLDARPAVLFLNGEFWGVHSMRERYDQKYFTRVMGLEEGEVDMVERYRHASLGDSIAWSALLDMVAVQDPMEPEVFQQLEQKIDMENHIDFHVAQVYVGNMDWPQNNWKVFRKRTNGLVPNAPYGHDGRWRWLVFDLDWGFNMNTIHPPNYPFLEWATTPAGGENTLLLRKLLRNQDYRHAYLNRAADMINTAFRPEVVEGIIEQHRALLAHDMVEHIVRWPNSPWTIGDWNNKVDVLVDFGNERADLFREELLSYFDLPGQHELQVDVSSAEAGWVELNSIHLLPSTHGVDQQVYPWSGIYFQEVPVTLTAHGYPGWAFSHWEGAVQSTDSVLLLSLTTATSVTAVFEQVPYCAPVAVHHWHFNDLPNGMVDEVLADQSMIPGGTITYAGEGAGYMDRTAEGEGTALNAMENSTAGRGLRARNPSEGRMLLIECPSVGHRDLALSFATHRTSAGASLQQVSYTIDPERQVWAPLEVPYLVADAYELRTFSLDGLIETFDNEHLAFKVEFLGPEASGQSGNNRFDNITLSGRPIEVVQASLCPGETVFQYEGSSYSPGSHLHVNSGAMDCNALVLVEVVQAQLDPSVSLVDNTLTAAATGVSYQWIDCSDMTNIPGADQQSFSPYDAGTYAVHLDGGGCSATTDCHFAPGEQGTGIVVHPNPAHDMLYIGLLGAAANSTYTLYDATGRVLRQGSFTGDRSSLDIRDLSKGTYTLEVIAEHGSSVQRWVKVVLK